MKRFIKNNIIGFILGAVIFGSIGVYAATVASSVVTYSRSGSSVETVEGALDEIYDNFKSDTYTFTSDQTSSVNLDNFYKNFDLTNVYNKGKEDGTVAGATSSRLISTGKCLRYQDYALSVINLPTSMNGYKITICNASEISAISISAGHNPHAYGLKNNSLTHLCSSGSSASVPNNTYEYIIIYTTAGGSEYAQTVSITKR